MTRWNNTVGRYQKVVMVKAKKVTTVLFLASFQMKIPFGGSSIDYQLVGGSR